MNIRQRISKRFIDDERGVVLVFVTLLMVVLFGFAGLAVDLGAAWAERRQDQSAADAAAMAAAIEYVRGAPTDDEIIAIVKDFVEQNIGYPTDGAGWATCPAPTDGFIPLAGNNCVSLKQASTLANDVLLKVRVPTQEVPTSFARLLGIDSIAVSAEAIARIEANPGVLGALPYAIPSGLADGSEYCLGTPPTGLSRDVCDGSKSGNYGTIDSPEFKAEADPWGTTGACDDTGNANARQERNTALGIDHFLRVAPPGEDPEDGQDTCVSAEASPAIIPYALLATKGEIKTDGFIGDGPYGSIPLEGRLRQGDGPFRELRAKGSGPSTIELDNVGLWEYLEPTDPLDECHSSNFLGSGGELTAALLECLAKGTVKFSEDLLTSPRFGLAPVIGPSDISSLSPSAKKAVNIVDFAPVYLQSSWFNCNATECAKWADDAGVLFDNFDPGEGSAIGCQVNNSGACANNQQEPNLNGISVILLTNQDWLPDSLKNEFDDPGGFDVYLFR